MTVLVCPTAQCVPRTRPSSHHVTPVAKFKHRRYVRFSLALCFVILGTTRSVFNNASARSAFSVNTSARQGACKLSRFKSKSKMATKTIMGFREGSYARNFFRFHFRNEDVWFFMWLYEKE